MFCGDGEAHGANAKQAGQEIAARDRSTPALAGGDDVLQSGRHDGADGAAGRGREEDGEPSKTREAKVAVLHRAGRSDPMTACCERGAHRRPLARPSGCGRSGAQSTALPSGTKRRPSWVCDAFVL